MSSNSLVVAPAEAQEAQEVAVRRSPSRVEIVAWLLMTGFVLYILFGHLAPALIGGLALYLILEKLSGFFSRRMGRTAARPLALLLVTIGVAGILFGGVAMTLSFLRHANNIPAMMTKMAEILQSTRAWLGGYGEEIIPEVMTDAENVKAGIAVWLKEHAVELKVAGGTLSRGLIHLLMGMLVAILVFFRHVSHHDRSEGPLARVLTEKVVRFAEAFGQIASAQIKISAVNTSLTALYLLILLPMFGKHLPFGTTIVLVTFVCGLIPVLGNLISNSVIVILSLGLSVGTAVASLVFLVLVHKLEYLINSRIVGGEIDAQAWEILMAILIGETAFGVSGVVIAPIVYAFVKRELRERGLV